MPTSAALVTKFSAVDYGSEFDEEAQKRMTYGCELMRPYIKKYAAALSGPIVEFGPFRNPLLTRESLPAADILYVDADQNVISELRKRYQADSRVISARIDLNQNEPLDVELRGWARLFGKGNLFNASVISQVLNYIDYKKFFMALTRASSTGSLLMVNNVIDYGIPELFAQDRPHNNRQMIEFIESLGWSVVEKIEFESVFTEQLNPRLILIVRKN